MILKKNTDFISLVCLLLIPQSEYFGGPDFCNYKNQRYIKEGDKLWMNDHCTNCSCNSTIKQIQCAIRTCPPTFCNQLVNLTGQCCGVCPYCKYINGKAPHHFLMLLSFLKESKNKGAQEVGALCTQVHALVAF